METGNENPIKKELATLKRKTKEKKEYFEL